MNETRKKSDTRNITLKFPGGQVKTYSVGSTTSKNDVVNWAERKYRFLKLR
jgi:hypothetical protein